MKAQESKYYNEKYKESYINYTKDYKKSNYYRIWTKVVERLKTLGTGISILEIGCGSGQLAKYLRDEGFINYIGFDFSTVAIEQASSISDQEFFVGSAYEKSIYKIPYDVVVSTEVLEHIDDDIQVLKNIRKGTNVVLSVPTFNCFSHVRFFRKQEDVINRYSSIIDIKDICLVDKIFIIWGNVK